MSKQIAVLVGSNSHGSFSQLAAQYLKNIAPASIQLNLVEIADLPLYDRDLDSNSPASYERVRAEIAKADGVIFISPEHNGAIPAMLKNVIDVVSRPMGHSKWIGKPAGIVTVAAGMAGGVRVADQLRTIASGAFIGMPVYTTSPNIGAVYNVFNDQGEVAVEAVENLLKQFINGYAEFVAKF